MEGMTPAGGVSEKTSSRQLMNKGATTRSSCMRPGRLGVPLLQAAPVSLEGGIFCVGQGLSL